MWGALIIILICGWMATIYYLSSMPGDESNDKSKAVIQNVVKKSESKKTNEVKEVVEEDNLIEQMVERLNKPIRKMAHATVYFVLAILVGIACIIFGIKGWMFISIPIAVSFVYACTDEFHQKFVPGRTCLFFDVMIDTCGSLMGILLFYLILIIKNRIL